MEHSESVSNLFAALSKCQGALKNASKDTNGNGYKYAQLSQIIDVSREALESNELAVLQMPSEGDESCKVTTMIVHSSGEWIRETLTMPVIIPLSNAGKPMMNHAQAVGNVITYCRRYSLAAFLNISQEDNDAAGGEGGSQRHVNTSRGASEKQVEFVRSLVQKKWNVDDFRLKFGVTSADELTSVQAKVAIEYIQNMPQKQTGPTSSVSPLKRDEV